MDPHSNPPESYTTLNLKQIRISHVPPSSSTPTSVVLVTLYRGNKHNAFTDTMASELVQAFDTLSHDPRVRAIVVTGHGHIFCAGADLESPEGLSSNRESEAGSTHRDGGGTVALAIHRCQKPVIGAINGSAVGVGITMTLPMNIRIVSEKAKIGFVFARRGIVMEACSSFFLPRLIGYAKAMHLVTTGAVYNAKDELVKGLFSEVLPTTNVLPRALEVADDIARNTSLVSTHLMKDMMWRGCNTAEETHLLDSKVQWELFEGEDKNEGVQSFLEKRAPKFNGTMYQNAPKVWPWWKQLDVAAPKLVNPKSKL
jgi:enoyl-CoA hydratase/carnithine racemase